MYLCVCLIVASHASVRVEQESHRGEENVVRGREGFLQRSLFSRGRERVNDLWACQLHRLTVLKHLQSCNLHPTTVNIAEPSHTHICRYQPVL